MAGLNWYDFATLPFGGLGFGIDEGIHHGTGNNALGEGPITASGVKNTLEGDPNSLESTLGKLQQTSLAQGNQIKDFLLGREQNAENYYQPMRQMFSDMYGTGGMPAAKIPGYNPTGGK
jgi:hypothetical protein